MNNEYASKCGSTDDDDDDEEEGGSDDDNNEFVIEEAEEESKEGEGEEAEEEAEEEERFGLAMLFSGFCFGDSGVSEFGDRVNGKLVNVRSFWLTWE